MTPKVLGFQVDTKLSIRSSVDLEMNCKAISYSFNAQTRLGRRQERRRERGELMNDMLEGICSQLTVVKQTQYVCLKNQRQKVKLSCSVRSIGAKQCHQE